jgi:hypothetical protein
MLRLATGAALPAGVSNSAIIGKLSFATESGAC